jgi:hypothetical protein
MSYGTNLADAYRLEGNYVGRIARVRNGNFFLRASLSAGPAPPTTRENWVAVLLAIATHAEGPQALLSRKPSPTRTCLIVRV